MPEDPFRIINNLPPEEALSILKFLAERDEALARRIAAIAKTRLSEVDPEEVAHFLYEELEMLEVEEVWDRAGPSRYQYVEPAEAASEMIDEVLAPFLEEMRQYRNMGFDLQARQMCMGMILGLNRFARHSTSEFKDWAPDAGDFVYAVLDAWQERNPGRGEINALKAFFEDELDGWPRYLNW